MDVYVIPVGNARYELYCEVSDDAAADADAGSRGVFRCLAVRFRESVAAAERERHQDPQARDPAARSWTRRLTKRALRWVAEAIAEQRLLWHLRRQAGATLVYPADVDEATAMRIARGALQRDADRHRFWLVVDGLGLLASVPGVVIPGPNILLYYFAFRVVGHYLSRRGARHGLDRVQWRGRPSDALADLRRALSLSVTERRQRVRAVASHLKLERLAAFFERTAISS